jgi:oligopeptide transport system permease protein
MRSTVIQVKHADYVSAARALGGGAPRILRSHVLPNAVAPVIVYATIVLGIFIGVEATLSFLGIGLQPPVISWGVAIDDASTYIRQSPHMLLFPGAFLTITVLAFIMLGDAVRDAFDPRLR